MTGAEKGERGGGEREKRGNRCVCNWQCSRVLKWKDMVSFHNGIPNFFGLITSYFLVNVVDMWIGNPCFFGYSINSGGFS